MQLLKSFKKKYYAEAINLIQFKFTFCLRIIIFLHTNAAERNILLRIVNMSAVLKCDLEELNLGNLDIHSRLKT